jgi:hypothetical protein
MCGRRSSWSLMLQVAAGPLVLALRQSSSPLRNHKQVEVSSSGDLRIIFGTNDKMRSEDIIGALKELPESPWRRFHADGSSLDYRDLAYLLREYDIRPRDVWIDGGSAKGYTADDLRDAWERYLHPSTVREVREVREGLDGTP